MRHRRGGYRGFGGPAPIMKSHGEQKGHRTKCWGCGQHINVGEPFVRLRLRKQFRSPCATCGAKPKSAKRFHMHCEPPDHAKAMGYNPQAQSAPPPPSFQRGGAVPPPPKPTTAEDAALAALLALENAIKARARGNPAYLAQIEAEFKTYQNIKARALRPGTEPEGVTAMKLALQRAMKLVF